MIKLDTNLNLCRLYSRIFYEMPQTLPRTYGKLNLVGTWMRDLAANLIDHTPQTAKPLSYIGMTSLRQGTD